MKKITLIIFTISLFALAIAFADSYELACLAQGESIDFGELCNPAMGVWHGPTTLCLHNYDNGDICSTSLNTCYGLGLSCTGGGSVDSSAPNITLTSPVEGNIYNERLVLFDINISEKGDIYYIDNIDGRGRWTRVCSNCEEYNNPRSFDEGFNSLTISARDNNYYNYYNVTFWIDSQDPRIYGIEPDRDFASGHFEVEFKENNPTTMVLHYGNDIVERRTADFNLSKCTTEGSKTVCAIDVPLGDYDLQEIEVWAVLTDIAGSTDESDHEILSVDTSEPVINDLSYDIDGGKVTFSIEVDELNLEEVEYIDLLDPRAKWKRLCSRLDDDGTCEKRISFKDGEHEVMIRVTDEVGLSVNQTEEFFTDSKDPRISKTEPKRDFASGTFYVEFTEENPKILALYYGDPANWSKYYVDLDEECSTGRRTSCEFFINLSEFDGQEITYLFRLIDRVLQDDISRRVEDLLVDTTYPKIGADFTYTIDGRYVTFNMSVDEANFEEVNYIDWEESRPKDRRLCSRLDDDNRCVTKKSFKEGFHDVSIQVFDEAGNSIAIPVQFTIEI